MLKVMTKIMDASKSKPAVKKQNETKHSIFWFDVLNSILLNSELVLSKDTCFFVRFILINLV